MIGSQGFMIMVSTAAPGEYISAIDKAAAMHMDRVMFCNSMDSSHATHASPQLMAYTHKPG